MLLDAYESATSREQRALEQRVKEFFDRSTEIDSHLCLDRAQHIKYLHGGLRDLPAGFASLEAAKPWILYWITHSLALLRAPFPEDVSNAGKYTMAVFFISSRLVSNTLWRDQERVQALRLLRRVAKSTKPSAARAKLPALPPSSLRPTCKSAHADIAGFLRSCQCAEGGFGGSQGQPPHLAPTYAAVASAVTSGKEALAAINKPDLLNFLQRCCIPPEAGGGFAVCQGGEVDVRGCYTAIATAHMMGLDKHKLAEQAGMVSFIRRCQTYEGGLGGEPGNEAHGGYTYCGLAALALIGRADALDLPGVLRFAASCQGTVEGGFMGRTNKLVDGCYSFWQAGLFPLLQSLSTSLHAQKCVPKQRSKAFRSPQKESKGDGESSAAAGSTIVPSLPISAPQTVQQQAQEALRRAQAEEATKRIQALSNKEGSGEMLNSASATLRIAQDAASQAARNFQSAAHTQELLEDCAMTRSSTASEGCLDESRDAGGTSADLGWHSPLYNPQALQTWLLLCCQLESQLLAPSSTSSTRSIIRNALQAPGGGLRDKPGKPPDYYHTCYCLSGLSLAQHFGGLLSNARAGDVLAKADPLCNVVEERLTEAFQFHI